jgi:hypothetical protein
LWLVIDETRPGKPVGRSNDEAGARMIVSLLFWIGRGGRQGLGWDVQPAGRWMQTRCGNVRARAPSGLPVDRLRNGAGWRYA